MRPLVKPTVKNIIQLWFSVDTPIRQYKVKHNPFLWAACQQVHQDCPPPARVRSVEPYRKSDKVAFAIAVQQQLAKGHS